MKQIFNMELYQSDDISVPDTCRGNVLISPTAGGTFYGDNISGEILPIGMCITTTPYKGKNDIAVTLILQTDDDAKIIMEIKAMLDIEDEEEAKLIDGETLESAEYYYKGTVSFRTGSDKYAWLERKICVCHGVIENWSKLIFDVYMI